MSVETTMAQEPSSANILIVDDTPSNVLLLERMLTERGYHTRAVGNGKLALESARSDPPDLILLDIMMPEMNGYEVCRQLKANAALRRIPVIFLSALHETIDKVTAFNVGGVDYITIPFQFEEVFARIKTHLHLRRLEHLQDDLTHMIVHDLRSPLTAIFGCLNYLKSRSALTQSSGADEFVAIAKRSAEEMLSMISSILDVSKMGAGKMNLQRELCDITAIIQGVVTASEPLPGERTVSLESHAPPVAVMADVVLIRRVFQNLISNAIKYTPVEGNVGIVITQSSVEVRISVTDSGSGIAPEYHQRIFEKFGQVESRGNRLGTGLGLAFCKLVVDAHGGAIGVHSEMGKGSTFWITLPQHHEPAMAITE